MGTAVSVPPAVAVRDGFGNPVSGVPVSFTVTEGGGSVIGGSATSDAGGLAILTSWTLGTLAGPNTLTVAAQGLPSVTFSATGQPGPPAVLAIQTGQNGSFVFIVEDGLARARTVVVDRTVDDRVVIASGLSGGETVVTDVGGCGLVEWLSAADVVRGDDAGAVPLRSVDPLTPLHRVPDSPPGRAAGAPGADPAAVLLTAAEQLGSATRACELAAQHARTREQFGRPIGAFQAVKHLCAEMLVRTETARAAVYDRFPVPRSRFPSSRRARRRTTTHHHRRSPRDPSAGEADRAPHPGARELALQRRIPIGVQGAGDGVRRSARIPARR